MHSSTMRDASGADGRGRVGALTVAQTVASSASAGPVARVRPPVST